MNSHEESLATCSAQQKPCTYTPCKGLATTHNAHQADLQKAGANNSKSPNANVPCVLKAQRHVKSISSKSSKAKTIPPYRRRNGYRPSFPPILQTMVLMKAASGTLNTQAGTNVTAKATSPPAMTYARACTIEPNGGKPASAATTSQHRRQRHRHRRAARP